MTGIAIEHRLTSEEREVLILLVQGLADQQVADRLSISRRTLNRRLRGVMERLGATSRMQVGYLLAHSGWLDEEVANGMD